MFGSKKCFTTKFWSMVFEQFFWLKENNKKFELKKFQIQNILGPKQFWSKKIWVQKKLIQKKCVPKNFWSKKMLGPKTLRSKRIWGAKKIRSKIMLVQEVLVRQVDWLAGRQADSLTCWQVGKYTIIPIIARISI